MSSGDHFNHAPRPCWYCVHWHGPAWGDPYMADCRRYGVMCCKANAANGCVHWVRETGVDDDGWTPPPMVRPKRPDARPFKMSGELYSTVSKIQADLDARG